MADINAADLYAKLSWLDRIADRKAISASYRAVALSPEHARAAAPFGSLRLVVDLGLDDEVCVDAADLIGVVHTAPGQASFKTTLRDNALRWSCGPARGHLSLLDATVPTPAFAGDLVPLAAEFGPGLALGAIACSGTAVARGAGLDGVQLQNHDDHAYAFAADGMMLSSACLGPALPMTQTVTLKPEAALLLAEVTQKEPGEKFIGIDPASVYYLADGTELQLNQIPPLRVNLAEKLEPWSKQNLHMPLMRETVASFIKRAEMLAEQKSAAMVEISVTKGRTTLAFHEQSGSTEEWYELSPKSSEVTVPAIRVEARRLARALAHADYLVLDYAEHNMLVLRGSHEFVFVIQGRR